MWIFTRSGDWRVQKYPYKLIHKRWVNDFKKGICNDKTHQRSSIVHLKIHFIVFCLLSYRLTMMWPTLEILSREIKCFFFYSKSMIMNWTVNFMQIFSFLLITSTYWVHYTCLDFHTQLYYDEKWAQFFTLYQH